MTRFIVAGPLVSILGLVPVSAMGQSTPPAQQSTPPAQQSAATAPPTTPVATEVPPPPPPLPPGTKSVIIQRVLVKVNGEAYTQTDLERAQTEVLAQQNQQADVKKAPTDEVLRNQLLEITPGIIVRAVNEILLLQKAHELGYKMSDDAYQRAVDNIKADNHITDEKVWKQALAQQGLTEEQLRKNLEQQYLVNAVKQSEVMGHAQMTDQEAQQYYKTHQQEFMQPAKVVLSEILVAVATETVNGQPSFNASADEAAHAKANEIHDELVKGADFAKLAADVSDSATKTSGGLIGDVNEADMADALRPILDALKPGEVTSPIRTSRGYQILRLNSRSPQQPKPFEAVRDEIAEKIYESRVDGETAKYLDKLRAQALIEWKDESLKGMYDKELAAEEKAGGAVPTGSGGTA